MEHRGKKMNRILAPTLKLILALFGTLAAVQISANADTLLVNDGSDDDASGFVDPFGGTVFNGTTNPAPQFGQPGFFLGTLGQTDTAAPNTSVAHRFTGVITGDFVPFLILTIGINESFDGAANDRILAGDASAGTNASNALVNLNAFAVTSANRITIDLIGAGLLATIQNNGFLDVLLTDDRNIDFIALSTNASLGTAVVPVPAALPLMASALIAGAGVQRRRRRAAK